jgi:hypothetical protein
VSSVSAQYRSFDILGPVHLDSLTIPEIDRVRDNVAKLMDQHGDAKLIELAIRARGLPEGLGRARL